MVDTAPPSPVTEPDFWDLIACAYAEDTLPAFTTYAEGGIRLASVREGMRVLDVACGPGTLTLLAARAGAHVDAVDFSPAMLAQLRASVARESLAGSVETHRADGQNLPFDAARYDAAFSMFGLFIFPDRARGFGELRRCLVPDGFAVVGSWHPIEECVPFFAAVLQALRERIPGMPLRREPQPLSDRDVFRDEMVAAGFRDVEVHEHLGGFAFPTMRDGWRHLQRTWAPVTLQSKKMGPAWPPVADAIYASLAERFGEGPQTVTLPAWLGVGRR